MRCYFKPPLEEKMSTRRKLGWAKGLFVCAVLASGLAYGGRYYLQHLSADAPEYRTVKVARGEVVEAVTASRPLDSVVKGEGGSQNLGKIPKINQGLKS